MGRSRRGKAPKSCCGRKQNPSTIRSTHHQQSSLSRPSGLRAIVDSDVATSDEDSVLAGNLAELGEQEGNRSIENAMNVDSETLELFSNVWKSHPKANYADDKEPAQGKSDEAWPAFDMGLALNLRLDINLARKECIRILDTLGGQAGERMPHEDSSGDLDVFGQAYVDSETLGRVRASRRIPVSTVDGKFRYVRLHVRTAHSAICLAFVSQTMELKQSEPLQVAPIVQCANEFLTVPIALTRQPQPRTATDGPVQSALDPEYIAMENLRHLEEEYRKVFVDFFSMYDAASNGVPNGCVPADNSCGSEESVLRSRCEDVFDFYATQPVADQCLQLDLESKPMGRTVLESLVRCLGGSISLPEGVDGGGAFRIHGGHASDLSRDEMCLIGEAVLQTLLWRSVPTVRTGNCSQALNHVALLGGDESFVRAEALACIDMLRKCTSCEEAELCDPDTYSFKTRVLSSKGLAVMETIAHTIGLTAHRVQSGVKSEVGNSGDSLLLTFRFVSKMNLGQDEGRVLEVMVEGIIANEYLQYPVQRRRISLLPREKGSRQSRLKGIKGRRRRAEEFAHIANTLTGFLVDNPEDDEIYETGTMHSQVADAIQHFVYITGFRLEKRPSLGKNKFTCVVFGDTASAAPYLSELPGIIDAVQLAHFGISNGIAVPIPSWSELRVQSPAVQERIHLGQYRRTTTCPEKRNCEHGQPTASGLVETGNSSAWATPKIASRTGRDALFQTLNSAPIAASNKGYQMLARMGWEKGKGLGAEKDGRRNPVVASINPGRRGLG